jgi:hypothetical protein
MKLAKKWDETAWAAADTQPIEQKPDGGHPGNGTRHPGAEIDGGHDAAADPFPLECLPPEIEAMARAICASQQVPESLAGGCALGALSCSIGAGLDVISGMDCVLRSNLFLMLSGESGSGKSKAFRLAFAAFIEFSDEQEARWKKEVWPGLNVKKGELEDDIKRLRDKRKGIEDGEERESLRADLERKTAELQEIEARLHPPTFYVQDVTSQTLGPIIMHQPGECLASLSADAREIVSILLGRYNTGGASGKGRTDENFYVSAWTGDIYKSNRMGREEVRLKCPCLAYCWLLQKDQLDSILRERSLMEGGFMARNLVCHTYARPQKTGGRVPIAEAVSRAYRQCIRALIEAYRLAERTRTILPTPEARAALEAHYDGIVDRWESGEVRDITSYALRWTEQAWRIALCIHAGIYGNRAHEMPLDLDTAERGIKIADWFSRHQLAIMTPGRMEQRLKRVDELQTRLANYGGTQTLREMERRHGFKREEIVQLAEEFPALLTYRREETGKAGRPSETISTIRDRI